LIFCTRRNQVAGLWDTTAWLVISAFRVSLTFGTSRSSTTSRGLCTSRQNGVDLPGAFERRQGEEFCRKKFSSKDPLKMNMRQKSPGEAFNQGLDQKLTPLQTKVKTRWKREE